MCLVIHRENIVFGGAGGVRRARHYRARSLMAETAKLPDLHSFE